jgi:signal transduction histidine kinase
MADLGKRATKRSPDETAQLVSVGALKADLDPGSTAPGYEAPPPTEELAGGKSPSEARVRELEATANELAELFKREQAARVEAENATRLKDQFFAILSHELRTPITSILVWARMLRENLCKPSEREEGLEVIERSAQAQKQLLDDLLDVSRIVSGKARLKRAETNLTDLVRLAVDTLLPTAEAKGVALKTDLAKNIGTIAADPDRLRQVIGNLVNNAVKFTLNGGRVDVRLRKDGDWVEISVTDTGKGIEPEFLPHVLTAFSQSDVSSTRSFGGLGLGLAISKELVELHGGTIHAESEGAGKGATFVVRLPITEPDKLTKRKG